MSARAKCVSSKVRKEAADMLAILASQPEWEFYVSTLPGRWSEAARQLAMDAQSPVPLWGPDGWPEMYAEAESMLRTGWSP